ncbi:hypothetical protein H2198_008042 [Neophaeococcomyces mojaviensis]|uniref:Uncharacterized protein n=1 Tax=Neophaeococcomyces mojaviensis TaxID=3383035 RepID=A0ACC2ZYG1_9EURO|nr:hypothetical protein H2198_008042 [Knufia sp. JES_112]
MINSVTILHMTAHILVGDGVASGVKSVRSDIADIDVIDAEMVQVERFDVDKVGIEVADGGSSYVLEIPGVVRTVLRLEIDKYVDVSGMLQGVQSGGDEEDSLGRAV